LKFTVDVMAELSFTGASGPILRHGPVEKGERGKSNRSGDQGEV